MCVKERERNREGGKLKGFFIIIKKFSELANGTCIHISLSLYPSCSSFIQDQIPVSLFDTQARVACAQFHAKSERAGHRERERESETEKQREEREARQSEKERERAMGKGKSKAGKAGKGKSGDHHGAAVPATTVRREEGGARGTTANGGERHAMRGTAEGDVQTIVDAREQRGREHKRALTGAADTRTAQEAGAAAQVASDEGAAAAGGERSAAVAVPSENERRPARWVTLPWNERELLPFPASGKRSAAAHCCDSTRA